MLDIATNTGVYTARDEQVGTVDRIVLDPSTRAVSHVVVRKGIFFPEDKLVPIGDIATATPERINLRQEVSMDDLPPFVEQYYVPLDERDRPPGPPDQAVRFAMPLSGPVGETMPTPRPELVPVRERNISERLTALEAGAPVFATGHEAVGRLERIVTTGQGQPSHIVVEEGGLSPDRRTVPIEWVLGIAEDAVLLDATREMIETIAPLDPDE
jgi:uncharacterized protein YrrD